MKRAIVIGATSGIGKGIARLLADNGYKVGITGRRTNLLEDLRKESPDHYSVKTFDITNTKSISNHLSELTQELGGLDLLIISSGTGDLNDNLDFEIEKRTIDTNVSGFTAIADWAFNYFKQQKSGHLVAISSIAGLRGSRQSPSYSASKAFQINYFEGLRQKARKIKYPIYITDVRPGFVDTDMAKGDGQFWVATKEKVAKQIFNLVKRKKDIGYVTKRWRLIAIILKIFPNRIYKRM